MFLKEIEIQGFKSFADKTKVVFDQGVTAVVGPNGSGKSNITESLRWALGESSVKSLRGGKMPDVIFAGTENRKPLNYASVVVVLDNQDQFIKQAGKEIRVERHIYRSGDSEYKIDGKKVRLRDVHDLFMDTGLGRDSFSIISQGKVEEIFNSKPEERRAIFEEAAGVLKYKTRRKETESKLAQTQDNLDRLEDIIYELDSQVKPLEKQAETAKRFLELDHERQELYLDVLVAQIKANKTDLTAAEADLESIKQELAAYYTKRDELERENQEIKVKRQEVNQKLSDDQASLLELTRLISDLERQIDLAKLESSQAASSRLENEERLAGLREKSQQLTADISSKEAHLADLVVQLTENQEAMSQLEAELADFSDDPDQLIENLRDRYVKLMQEEADLSNDLTSLENRLENERSQAASKQAEFSKLQADLKAGRDEEAARQAELEAAQAALRDLLDQYQQQEEQVEKLATAYQNEQTSMFALLDDLKNKKARAASLEAILKNHSNFYAGVKSVLQEADRLGGIVGAVSEKSFDPHYQTALEIALGASSQHIIVEDEGAATRAIDFLKKNRAGRATFLPLTTIKARQLPEQNQSRIEASSGFLGIASELVTYEPGLENIFQNLLGTTAIFDTIEHARAAARQVRYQVRIVTLDGTELRTGGSYAGGANRNNNTIFIKPELDSLLGEMEQQSQKLKAQEQQVESLQSQLSEAKQALEAIKSEGEQARLTEQRVKLAYEQIAERVAELSQLEQLQEQDLANQTEAAGLAEKKKMEERLSAIEASKVAITAEIEQVKSNKNAVQDRFDQLSANLSELKLKSTELTSSQRFEKNDLSRLLEEKAALDKEVVTLQLLIEQKEEAVSQKVDISVLEEQLKTAQEKKTDLDQSLIRLKFELDDLEGQSEDILGNLDQARQQNESLIRRQAKAEAEKEKFSDALRRLLTNLTDNYQISFEEADQRARSLENLAAAEAQVKDLEKAIRALGPVNLEAVEQFEEVSNRLNFLKSQRDDVLSAKNLLLETIEEMNDEVKERFQTTFEAIRESFKLTFSQMFGGGSADLILTEGDLLTAGVEISVQPPGKKIQSLNLMSGGEKALSALALLFSIIRVKTIPFVILDEVEAALDEANVKRFGDYLNRFDKESQFIVVTHRKGTMSAADSIYGVTMQESGVSKIVSVKLKDLESL